MAAPGNSPIAIAFEGISGTGSIPTPVLLAGMLRASEKVSDLIFSPGRPPQVEIHGQLTAVEISGSSILSADDTRRIAADLIGTNKQAINTLREQGSCDVSYGLPGMARFRVNVFIQRGQSRRLRQMRHPTEAIHVARRQLHHKGVTQIQKDIRSII